MKAAIFACVLLGLASQAFGQEFNSQLEESGEGRLLFNSSSTATSLTLLGALILLGVIFYLIYVGGLGASSYNRNDYGYYGQYDGQYENAQYQYRSNNDGYEMSGLNILTWIEMLRDLYENFDYNDLECQKRLICEVMKEPEYYGSVARKFKAGFQYAKYLEVLSLPDDMRELLDEYLDANARSDMQKDCAEYFQCPYSVRDSMKRSQLTNGL